MIQHTKENQELIQKVINKGKKPLYQLFDNKEVDIILSETVLEQTLWRGERSKRSLQFKCDDTKQCNDLVMFFGLDAASFENKYRDSISGFEEQRIRTLHSSSLLCLLCFYGISETRSLEIDLDGHRIRFYESIFEEKNIVGEDDVRVHKSNVDVVLKGKDIKTHRDVCLFLEAKFSEYLTPGNHYNISNQVYESIYKSLNESGVLKEMGLVYKDKESDRSYSNLSSVEKHPIHYASGIKQMISHYLGVSNAIENGKYKDCDVYLGTILYHFGESIDPAGIRFKDYSEMYEKLAVGLNNLAELRFKVLNHCLTYQEVFKEFELDKKVKTFYSL